MPTPSDALESLLRLCALGRLPRTGWLAAGLPVSESIAAHSHGASLVALALGGAVDPPLDVDRAVALAAAHDLPEALLGDLPRDGAALLPPGVKAAAERAAAAILLAPLGAEALARHAEYSAQQTREARFARLCDKLHLGLALAAAARAGARIPADFRASVEGLDTAGFRPCEELRRAILTDLDRSAD